MESIRAGYNQVFDRVKQKISAYSSRIKSEREEIKEIFQENWLEALTLEDVRILRRRITDHPALKGAVTLGGGAVSDGGIKPLSKEMQMVDRAFALFPPTNSILHGKELSPELQAINSKLELLELSKIMNINLGDKKAPIHCIYLDKKDCSTTDWNTIIWHLTKLDNRKLQHIEQEIQHFTSEKICEIRSYIKNLINYQQINANSQNIDRKKKQQLIPILTNKLMGIFIDLSNDDPDKYTFIKFIQVVEKISVYYSRVQTLGNEFELPPSDDSSETEIAGRINDDVLIKEHLREICHHSNVLVGTFNQKANGQLIIHTNSASDLLCCLKKAYLDYADRIDRFYESKVYSVNYYENHIPTDAKSKAEAHKNVQNFLSKLTYSRKEIIFKIINEFKDSRSRSNVSVQEQKLAELDEQIYEINLPPKGEGVEGQKIIDKNDKLLIDFCTIIKNSSRVFKVKDPHNLKEIYNDAYKGGYEGVIGN